MPKKAVMKNSRLKARYMRNGGMNLARRPCRYSAVR